MCAARSSVVIAVAGRVAREREGHRRGLGDVGLPEARGESGMQSHKDGRSVVSAHEGSTRRGILKCSVLVEIKSFSIFIQTKIAK